MSNQRWRFCQFSWPSQKIWSLSKKIIYKRCLELRCLFRISQWIHLHLAGSPTKANLNSFSEIKRWELILNGSALAGLLTKVCPILELLSWKKQRNSKVCWNGKTSLAAYILLLDILVLSILFSDNYLVIHNFLRGTYKNRFVNG